jgi:hypothetical protein
MVWKPLKDDRVCSLSLVLVTFHFLKFFSLYSPALEVLLVRYLVHSKLFEMSPAITIFLEAALVVRMTVTLYGSYMLATYEDGQ